jgi:predicted pyridoxine 5'-phosphate oxidase superfamily flavin-nucleotide-binding protein
MPQTVASFPFGAVAFGDCRYREWWDAPGLIGSEPGAKVAIVQLTADMQRVVLDQRLGFVASVTPDGAPNLSPKGTTTVWDDEHLMFADIVSPGTVANIRANPRVEVNVVDPIVRTGYRFKGIAIAYVTGPMFDRGLELLHELGSTLGPDRVRSIVVIEVTDAATLVSPAYDAGATESDVVARWLAHHTDLHPPRA